jgi:hypothetical protein
LPGVDIFIFWHGPGLFAWDIFIFLYGGGIIIGAIAFIPLSGEKRRFIFIGFLIRCF